MRNITAIPVAAEKQTVRSVKLLMAAAGFLPVISIVLHCAAVVPLKYSTLLIVMPSWFLLILPWLRFPRVARLAFEGWCAGIIAVLLYDMSRVPFMLNGWPDFIPRIGEWLMDKHEAPAGLGYLWRYLGNGGGMGMSFFLLLSLFPVKYVRVAGLSYGLFIFACLILSLVVIPGAQEAMFRITPVSFAGSLAGHIVYGLVLGLMVERGTSLNR